MRKKEQMKYENVFFLQKKKKSSTYVIVLFLYIFCI